MAYSFQQFKYPLYITLSLFFIFVKCTASEKQIIDILFFSYLFSPNCSLTINSNQCINEDCFKHFTQAKPLYTAQLSLARILIRCPTLNAHDPFYLM